MDASQLDFSMLAPIACVSIGALAVLLSEALFTPRRVGFLLASISSAALVLAIFFAALAFVSGDEAVFNPARPMLRLDVLSAMAIGIVSVGALLSVWLSVSFLPSLGIHDGEYHALLLLAVAGMFVLVMSTDLISVFMGLELLSLPLYALAAFDRRSSASSEAGLKYFLLGVFASAVLLYGMALLYGATGQTGFAEIAASEGLSSSLAIIGMALVVVGLAFKISSVPFHQWVPDVYEGAPTCVTAFMAVTVKCAAFALLLRFLELASPDLEARLDGVFWVLAALTLVVGNVMAVIQSNVKRLIAYSSISHAGVMLVALVTGTPEAHAALLFYLFVYVFMNAGFFAVIVALTRDGESCETVADFAGLADRRPGMAAAMSLFLFALAGIPGTGGFIAKFQVFAAALGGGFIWLTLIGVATSLVGLFYYLRLPVAMYMQGDASDDAEGADLNRELGALDGSVLAICVLAVLYFGLLPDKAPFEAAVRPLVSQAELSATQHPDVTLPAGDVELVE